MRSEQAEDGASKQALTSYLPDLMYLKENAAFAPEIAESPSIDAAVFVVGMAVADGVS